jgi:hypothetical protein
MYHVYFIILGYNREMNIFTSHKGKGHRVTGHEGSEVQYTYSSTLSLNLALAVVDG